VMNVKDSRQDSRRLLEEMCIYEVRRLTY